MYKTSLRLRFRLRSKCKLKDKLLIRLSSSSYSPASSSYITCTSINYSLPSCATLSDVSAPATKATLAPLTTSGVDNDATTTAAAGARTSLTKSTRKRSRAWECKSLASTTTSRNDRYGDHTHYPFHLPPPPLPCSSSHTSLSPFHSAIKSFSTTSHVDEVAAAAAAVEGKSKSVNHVSIKSGGGVDLPAEPPPLQSTQLKIQEEEGRVGDAREGSRVTPMRSSALTRSINQPQKPSKKALDQKQQLLQRRQILLVNDITRFGNHRLGQKVHEYLDSAQRNGLPFNVIIYNASITALRKSGMQKEALQLFQQMKNDRIAPDVVTYNALLAACVAEGRHRKALELVTEMDKEAGLKPDEVTYNTMMSVFARSRQPSRALNVFRGMREAGLKPSLTSYNTALNACSKARDYTNALKLLRSMQATDDVKPDELSYNSAISACAEAVQPTEALNLLVEMSKVGLRPDLRSFNAALHACNLSNQPEMALEMLSKMRSHGPKPDTVSFGITIQCCSKNNLYDLAIMLMNEMKLAGLKPNHRIWNSLMENKIVNDDFKGVLTLFEQMREAGIHTILSYGAAITAYGKMFQPHHATQLLVEMKKHGHKPNLVHFNSAIHACAITKLVVTALALFQQMQREGVQPDLVTYTSLINACCSGAGRASTAMELLQELVSKGFKPTLPVFTQVISAFAAKNFYEDALSVLEVMKQTDVYPDLTCYNAIIAACGQASDVAIGLLASLEEIGLTPDAYSYTAAINACAKANEPEKAVQLLAEMKQKGISPTIVTYNSVLSSFIPSQLSEQAFQLMEEMKKTAKSTTATNTTTTTTSTTTDMQADCRPDLVSYNCAISACDPAAGYELPLQLLSDLIEAGYTPDTFSYNAVIHACARSRGKKKRTGPADDCGAGVGEGGGPGKGTPEEEKEQEEEMVALCLRLVEDMRRTGVRLDSVTYRTVIDVLDSCCSSLNGNRGGGGGGSGGDDVRNKVDELYAEAVAEGLLCHWNEERVIVTDDGGHGAVNVEVNGSGGGGGGGGVKRVEKRKVIDLHGLPVSCCKAALRYVLCAEGIDAYVRNDDVTHSDGGGDGGGGASGGASRTHGTNNKRAVTIITGWGARSATVGESVVKRVMMTYLAEGLGVEVKQDERNPGRLVMWVDEDVITMMRSSGLTATDRLINGAAG